MSEIQLGAAVRGDDLEKNSGDTAATVAENGEYSRGIPSAQEPTVIPTLENQVPTAPPAADSTLGHQVVIPPVSSAALSGELSGNEDPLRAPLISKQAGDIEQGGEDEEENEALEEIDNILWVKGLPRTPENRCKEALKSWSKKDKLFTSRIDRKRKQSSDFQNEVYQLIGFFSVFQGVLLTAVAQSNLLHCNNTWTATLLSSLASFVTVIGVILKLRSIKELEHTIANEELTRRALVTWQLKLRESGPRFDFKEAKAKTEGDKKTSWWLNATFLAITVVLFLFSVAFVVSIRQILCNPGHSLLPGS